MQRTYTDRVILFSAAAANGAASTIMQDFRNIEVEIAMAGFTGTVKLAGSNADVAPDFTASASAANPWDFIRSINQLDGTSVAGGTGISGTATTSVTNLEANTNGFKWVAAIISSYSAGAVSVRAKGYSNE